MPGSLVAGRYRVIALLGQGGMGEVYRADDLTLGQPVALKFLPDQAAADEALLERFRGEVRIARRVSHPNVCRVYDVGEIGGQSYFTMEYVDGEDLAALLRRIGRLPSDKALDIARQLCAGLAAAHSKGVLHRDLKPANIMLDGRGQVVITDFGLAAVVDQIQGSEVRSGTPAYMAPEQLSGKEVSVRSDIYSLGLVLYEVFTGKRAFTDESAVRRRTKADWTPSRPSSVVKDLDPAVERAILRCLEEDPASRPASVLSLAAALPGGDPLAAALAAGETPSPEMVAAAGQTTGLRPKVAILCAAAVLAGLALAVFVTIRSSGFEKMGLDRPPEVLAQKARDIVAELGYDKKPTDSASGMYVNGDVVDYLQKSEKSHANWDQILAGRSSAVQFWYRQSPQYLVADSFRDIALTPDIVTTYDPPAIIAGMVQVELDPQGRLVYFLALPPELESPATASSPVPDWSKLFAAAELDPAQLKPTSPIWNTLASSDSRQAWQGTWPGTSLPLRVEAASWRGKPVFFALFGDWTKPFRSRKDERTRGDKIRDIVGVTLLLSILFGAAALARRNYRLGRADRQGAFRLATIMMALELALWLFRGHMVPSLQILFPFLLALSTGLFVSWAIWLIYLAIEPWVRRTWPEAMITWSRLLAGKFRDPLVGRDLLFGVLLGVLWIVILQVRYLLMMRQGAVPATYIPEFLLGGREAFGAWLVQIPSSITGALEFFFILLGLKVLLRKDWLAIPAFIGLFVVLHSGSPYPAVELPAYAVVYAVAVLIVYRYGLISLAVAIFTADLVANVPFTADFSKWYLGTSVLLLLSVVAIAAWGFYHSLGGRPLWKDSPG